LYFILNTDILKNLIPLNLLAVVLAALGHDVGHPALTNRFLVNNRDPLAIQYNDSSVLENMHSSMTFGLMNKPKCNLLEGLSQSDWVICRKFIIEMILETDMSKHFEVLAKFKTRAIILNDLNINENEDKCAILAMGLKCADIGHSAKDTNLHVKWTKLVSEEFFAQGDLEKLKQQSVSMYCDRETTDLPKSQVGFLKNICIPLYEVWAKYLDSELINTIPLTLLKNNMAYWENMIKKRKGTVIAKMPDTWKDEAKRRQSEF
jgi:3',5'-cyclic-nucleotide phosphodiesterase/cAMP-specific phosphodiesterase 4